VSFFINYIAVDQIRRPRPFRTRKASLKPFDVSIFTHQDSYNS